MLSAYFDNRRPDILVITLSVCVYKTTSLAALVIKTINLFDKNNSNINDKIVVSNCETSTKK